MTDIKYKIFIVIMSLIYIAVIWHDLFSPIN